MFYKLFLPESEPVAPIEACPKNKQKLTNLILFKKRYKYYT